MIKYQSLRHERRLSNVSNTVDAICRGEYQIVQHSGNVCDERYSSLERDHFNDYSYKDCHQHCRAGHGTGYHTSREIENDLELGFNRVRSAKKDHTRGGGNRRPRRRPLKKGCKSAIASNGPIPSPATEGQRAMAQGRSIETSESAIPQVSYIPRSVENPFCIPFMLLLVGIPGSGKSTFADALQTAMPYKYVRVSQDTLGSRPACEKMARSVLEDGKCPIIDRCNFDRLQRKNFLNIASEKHVHVDCVVFIYPKQECVRRCENRRNHETVSRTKARKVVGAMFDQFSPPLPNGANSEVFRSLRNVSDTEAFHGLVLEYLNTSE